MRKYTDITFLTARAKSVQSNHLYGDAGRVARAIRAARKASGLSQEQLAEAAQVTRPSVSNWERGLHAPTAQNLEDVARAMRMTVDALLDFAPASYDSATQVRAVHERAPERAPDRALPPRVPPAAYQLVYDHCRTLVDAGVPDELVEEARKLMSGETFNTLHAHMADERDERGWINDVQAAWAFIQQTLRAQGFDL